MLFRFALIMLFSWSLAQSFPDLQGVVATDSRLLDVLAIHQAATKLETKNIKLLVLFVEANVGSSLDEASAYFDAALESYGLLSDGRSPRNLFALFVGTNPLANSDNQRPIYIAYGQDLVPTLRKLAGSKDVDSFIRNELMIPKLLEGDFTGAFTSAISSLAERLPNTDASFEPIVNPVGNPVQEPQVNELLKRYGWLGIPILALLGVLGFRQRSRSKAKTSLEGEATTRDVMDSELHNDLEALQVALPADSQKQTEMILLSDYLKDEHPEEWKVLNTDYQEAVKKRDAVAQSLQSYDLQHARKFESLQSYEALQNQLLEVKNFVQSLNDKWLILNREVLALPDRISALKGSLQQVRVSYKERSEFLSADEVLKPLEEDIREVETLNQANQSLKSLKLLNQTQTNVTLVNDSLTRLMNADNRLDEFEHLLPTWQQQGFKLFRFTEHLSEVRSQFAIALGLIKQGEYKVLDAQVDEVEEQVSDIVDGGRRVMDVYKTNQQRLIEFQSKGEDIKELIEKTAQTFDKVDNFAQVCWRDIAGNGSQAQEAADQAFELHQQALEQNKLDGLQDFERVKEILDQGFTELSKAQDLLVAIEDRLARLTEAQVTAKDQLELVERDLKTYQEQLRQPQIDKVVSQRPDLKLKSAAEHIEKAKRELSVPQPNWLLALEYIQAADHLSDEALELMRSEQEAMQHRLVRVQSEKMEAKTALERLKNYNQNHASVIGLLTQEGIQQADSLYAGAERLEVQASGYTEELLAQTLEQAAQTFNQAEQKAAQAFLKAEKDVEDNARQLQQEAQLRQQLMAQSQEQADQPRERNIWSSGSSSGSSWSSRSSSVSSSSRSSSSSSSRSSGSWGSGGRKSGGGW